MPIEEHERLAGTARPSAEDADSRGYRLLSIAAVANCTDRKDGGGFVYKSVMYVLGRPADVEPFDPKEDPR